MGSLIALVLIATLASLSPAASAPADSEVCLWQPYRITPRTGDQHLALDGEWQLGRRDKAISAAAELDTVTKWFAAQVPSTVQWALHRAGKYGHPYEHLNSQQYDWVRNDLAASVEIFDFAFASRWRQTKPARLAPDEQRDLQVEILWRKPSEPVDTSDYPWRTLVPVKSSIDLKGTAPTTWDRHRPVLDA